MDVDTSEVLTNVLEKDEIEKIPSDIVAKLEKYCDDLNGEFMTTKVLCDTAQKNNDQLRLENNELSSKTQEFEAKIEEALATVTALTQQLETANSEIAQLTNQFTQNEQEATTYRKERNDIIDQRDQLLKISSRKDGTIECLQAEIKILENQLKSAVFAKSEALNRLDIIENKERTLDFKEKRMEKEKELLMSEIANLTDNLNRNMSEVSALRQENTSSTVQMEIELKQKTEELRIVNASICQLTETNQLLTSQAEENALKLKEQMNESARLMSHYQQQADAKAKESELFKATCDESQAQINDLTAAVKELKRMLNETTDECGEMETKLKGVEAQHQLAIDEKEEENAQLKNELKIANEMLKAAEDDKAEKVFENLNPAAAAAGRRLKSGMTMTEIISCYYKTLEENQCKDRELNQLKMDMQSIILEIQENAPEIAKQRIDFQKTIAINEELTQKINDFVAEKVLIREELQETRSKFGYLERENAKLKSERADLSRQVCYLLNEIEMTRGGMSSDQSQSISSDMPANEVISQKLVTFNNIVEMQENNQKLLLLVRDLSTKLEEMEEIQNNIDVETYEAKISSYQKRLYDAEESRRANEEVFEQCLKEKDRFKKLYYEIMKDACKKPFAAGASFTEVNMQDIDDERVVNDVRANTSQNATKNVTDKKLLEIEQSLQEKTKELKDLKEEYNVYRKEKSTDIKQFTEQIDTLRSEIRELTATNLKVTMQSSFTNEQIKTQQKNVAIYKKQIETLEERNQILDKTVNRHELAYKYLRDEATNTMKKLSNAESRCEQLQRECRRLMDVNKNLEIEHQSLNREKLTNSILQSNLEMLKGSFERLDNEGRLRMEQRLDDTVRECSALRRRLQEEQDHFREEINVMKLQTDGAVKKMSEEKALAEVLKEKVTQAEEQIAAKNQEIINLTQKIQESVITSHTDNSIVDADKKIKELEQQLKIKNSEKEKLSKRIETYAEKEKEYRLLASRYEEEAKALNEKFDMCKSKMSADMEALKINEMKLKVQVEELQTEIRLQVTDVDTGKISANTESKAQTELKEALLKISEKDRELRDLRSECHQLKVDLQTIEHKYSNEMQVHSSDLQALNVCKEELNKCQQRMDELRAAKDSAIESLEANRLELEKLNNKAAEERLELEQRLECLNEQNTALHDELMSQNNKVLLSSDSMNESIGNSSMINRSLTDEEVNHTSTEQLLKVIKFLRKEKNLSVTKVEILKTENNRLLNELEIQRKHLSELNLQLAAAKAPTNVSNVVSAAKYDELMRKVETINAMTDSNIHLREERDTLVSKVKDLTERVTKLEEELFPLQEKNRELLIKNDEQVQMANMLRTNVDHWRKRASDLVERNNKNPEDFKRLQNERENLAKMLTAEKENLRLVNDELNSIKSDKTRMEQEFATTNKQLHITLDEKKKIQDELLNLKQTNVRLTQEIIEIKSTILKKEDEIKALQAEVSTKDLQLTDTKNKEIQIRRIAKKYKDSFYELKTKEDEREAELAAKSLEEQAAASTAGGVAGLAAARAELEKVQAKKVEDLTSQLASSQEEIEQLRKENENLKKQDEKSLLNEARSRIATLTEANRQINRDYQTSKTQLQTCEQSRSDHDSVVAALKSQLDAKVKELSDMEASRQETIARLTRDNETLNTRVNQLHRQFQQQGSKPSTSSGTIEKSPSDPARTANVKPMATPTPQQSATVNPRRGADTPLASIRPMSVQNSRTAAVLPTSQTSNIAAVQGSSTGTVTTALVPPQQQVHTTGNSSTAEAMSSSPTSSHTDYMPATSSAVVVAVPPMGSTSAESTQEAESLSVNTNESSSSSSSTSSQAVVQQQQAVALVSPRVEVAPQNALAPSQQVADQNQAASTSGSSSSFLTTMSSHHQASSSNTVTTTQAGGHKRPRDAEGDSSTGVEESSASEKTSPQTKRTRLGEQTFQGVSESGLDVEYQVPTSSQRDQEDDVVAVDSDDEDDDGMDDEATADVDEAFDAENGDTDEIESFGQDEGEGHDIDEDNVRNDTNEVDVDDGSNAPNQSSSGIAASSGVRTNSNEAIEPSPLSQETQQIQMISSGSDAGPSGQGNNWRQAQAPARQQQNLIIQQAYEETGDDSIVPSTPTLYVARRADGFSEAVSSPHPIVPHASRFTFNDSGANRVPAATIGSVIEGMDDTRIDLNLLDESGEGGQSSSVVPTAVVDDSDNQPIVVVDLIDESSNENKEADQKEPVAGPSGQTEGTVPEIMVTDTENENAFEDNASTSHGTDDKNVSIEIDAEDEDDVGTDGVSSEGEKSSGQDGIQVEEGREAEASIQMTTDNTQLRNTRSRGKIRGRSGENQRPTPIVWDEEGRDQQVSPHQQHSSPRGSPIRGQLGRVSRGRGRRPYRS